jgi:hypothetical protein
MADKVIRHLNKFDHGDGQLVDHEELGDWPTLDPEPSPDEAKADEKATKTKDSK